jgi:penicillin V acylase-like amidase (Ntn superfamily)
MIRAIAIVLPLLTAASAALACTAVDMIAADKSVVAGRTMEWAFDMKWTLVSQPKGTSLSLIAPKSTGLPAKTVVTKYPVGASAPASFPAARCSTGRIPKGCR